MARHCLDDFPMLQLVHHLSLLSALSVNLASSAKKQLTKAWNSDAERWVPERDTERVACLSVNSVNRRG